MVEIVTEQFVQAPLERVYQIARQIDRFPEWLDYVSSIKIKERTDDGQVVVSEWEAFVPMLGLKARWVERDEWDESGKVCRFTMTEGDFDKYEGEWTFEEQPNGTLMRLRIDYEYQIPIGGALIQQLVRKIVEQIARKFLEGIARAAKSTP